MLSRVAAEAWWGLLAAVSVIRTYRPAILVAVTLRSRVTSFFFYHIKRMLTVGVTRRDATGRAGGRGDRGRDCGKVRQYEQTCGGQYRAGTVCGKSFFFTLLPILCFRFLRAYSRAACYEPGMPDRETGLSKSYQRQLELGPISRRTITRRNIVAMIVKRKGHVSLEEIDRESIGCDE